MWQSIQNLLRDLGEQWDKLSGGKKVGALTLFGLLLACIVGLGVWVGEKSFAPLYTNLQPDASIALVKILQEENIPYLVSNDGGTISIPPELVQPTLMKLAVRGTPGGQKPGLELFDKESFGTSSFVQRINYVRALQGELTRTINTLRSVRKSNVHVSMPPKSSFLEQTEDPKASVVVELHPGKTLAKEEVRGIQNLVAASIEGLRPERVTVVDTSGVALSQAADPIGVLSTTMLERQTQVQRQLEARVEEIVSRIVGRGNVVVRVNADLDFDPVVERETLYDPEQTALRSQDKQENNMEASRASPGAAGVAGAGGALPGPASTGPESRQAVAKSNDRQQFEVSNKIRNREKALGSVKRLSVAVLVNHETSVDPAGKSSTKPLADEKRVAIEKLVKDAVGFVNGRDSVSIESSPFASEDLDKADQLIAQRERQQLIYSLLRYGTVGLIVMFFFMLIVRPFVRWITGISTTKIETVLPRTVEELETMQNTATNALPGLANLPLLEETVDIEKAEGELLKEKIMSLVDMSPDKAARIISDLLALDLVPDKKPGKRK